MNTKKKELNTMNAIACLLVILIHVFAIVISEANPKAWQTAAIFIPWKASAFVVPMFLYTGAVKVALYYSNKQLTPSDYIHYILKRIKKIYLPYILWVIIYYISFLHIGYVRGEVSEFFQYLFDGTLSSPFYYVIVVMQFYLLLPLWIFLLRKIPAYVGISVAVLISLMSRQLSDILAYFNLSFAYTDRIFPTYMVFWVLGLYAGKSYDATASMIRKRTGALIAIVTVLFCIILSYIQYRNGRYFLNMENIKIVSDILSIALLQSFALKLNNADGKISKILKGIYESSFFVYLSHCLFLTLVTYFFQKYEVTGLVPIVIGRFVICYTLPFLLYKAKKSISGFMLKRSTQKTSN